VTEGELLLVLDSGVGHFVGNAKFLRAPFPTEQIPRPIQLAFFATSISIRLTPPRHDPAALMRKMGAPPVVKLTTVANRCPFRREPNGR
jgi:hypothetical protein